MLDKDEPTDALTVAVERLTKAEHAALIYFQKSTQPAIDNRDVSEEMFSLYAMGKTCDDIRKLKKAWSLGQIVALKVFQKWDERMDAERVAKMERLPGQVATVQADSIDTIARLLSIMNKTINDAMDMYLATKDARHLKLLPDLKEYRANLEAMMKMTGQKKQVIEVRHSGNVTNKPITSDEAGAYLDAISTEVPEDDK